MRRENCRKQNSRFTFLSWLCQDSTSVSSTVLVSDIPSSPDNQILGPTFSISSPGKMTARVLKVRGTGLIIKLSINVVNISKFAHNLGSFFPNFYAKIKKVSLIRRATIQQMLWKLWLWQWTLWKILYSVTHIKFISSAIPVLSRLRYCECNDKPQSELPHQQGDCVAVFTSWWFVLLFIRPSWQPFLRAGTAAGGFSEVRGVVVVG